MLAMGAEGDEAGEAQAEEAELFEGDPEIALLCSSSASLHTEMLSSSSCCCCCWISLALLLLLRMSAMEKEALGLEVAGAAAEAESWSPRDMMKFLISQLIKSVTLPERFN